jgi:NADH-quinone oxidoreductase subunit M
MVDASIELLSGTPLISLVIFFPLFAGMLLWLLRDYRHVRGFALAAAVAELLLTLAVLVSFRPQSDAFQLVNSLPWMPGLGVSYLVGVDGISVLFLPLTALLFVGVIISSWTRIQSMPILYYSLLLLLESSMMGIFCALDTILFFLFWELTLIPFYFLISLWGMGPNRRFAAVKYTLFMLIGGVPLLVAFLLLAFNHAAATGAGIPAGLAFDLPTLLATPVPGDLQLLLFLLLLLGFAVKTPVFPLHTWLPTVALEGPVGIAALMAGLKLGAYGIIRYAIPLAPQAAVELHWLLAGLGVIGILYGAVIAIVQSNLRRMLAFSSISHVGLVLLGVASFNIQGIQGALFQLLNFTLIAGGLFIITGFLHHRTGSTDIRSLGGVAGSMPLLTALFFFFALAAMGVPGTSGFPAELLIIISALKSHAGAGLAALFGLVIGAVYTLGIYRKAFLGSVQHAVVADAVDLRRRELWLLLLFAGLVLLAGLFPGFVLDWLKVSADGWIQRLI